MTLTTYNGLVASIRAWLMDRADLAAVIPDFVTLAEADMTQRLRLRLMMRRVVSTLASEGYAALPDDCLQIYRLTLDGSDLEFSGSLQMAGIDRDWRGRAPMYYSIVGEQIQFSPVGPTPGGQIEMTYYARPTPLSADNQTNKLLQAAPSAYLYGSLIQSAPYLADDARVQTWGALYAQSCDLLQAADNAAEFPGPLVPRASAGAWG